MSAGIGGEQTGPDTRHGSRTAREIAQQPELWRSLATTISLRRTEAEAFLRPLLRRRELDIILTGAGSSAFAGEILAPALARSLGRRVDAIPTTDIVSNPRECLAADRPTLIVSLARSGDSPESVGATRLADRCRSECFHLVVTCNRDGELNRAHRDAERSFVLLMPPASNDLAFAMTSSFTCMLLATLLAFGDEQADAELVGRVCAAAQDVLSIRANEARALAERGFERVVFLGSGSLKGLARESALKLLELTAGRVIAYADSPLGFRHGPKAVLADRTLAVVYLSNDRYTRRYDLDLLHELGAAMPAGSVLAIMASDESMPEGDGWRVAGLDDVGDAVLALPFVLCAQLLALNFSIALGEAPDNPFPSGEINRVVRGVTIHELVPGG